MENNSMFVGAFTLCTMFFGGVDAMSFWGTPLPVPSVVLPYQVYYYLPAPEIRRDLTPTEKAFAVDHFRNLRPSGNFCVAPVLESSRTSSTLRFCAP
jgi:hypothetical protein